MRVNIFDIKDLDPMDIKRIIAILTWKWYMMTGRNTFCMVFIGLFLLFVGIMCVRLKRYGCMRRDELKHKSIPTGAPRKGVPKNKTRKRSKTPAKKKSELPHTKGSRGAVYGNDRMIMNIQTAVRQLLSGGIQTIEAQPNVETKEDNSRTRKRNIRARSKSRPKKFQLQKKQMTTRK